MDPRGTDARSTGSTRTDYRVETSGRVLLLEQQEEKLLPALRAELVGRSGRYDGAEASLEELARSVGVRSVRDGDHLLLVTDREGDTRWTEQGTAFFAVLAGHAVAGEVRFRGDDGVEWAVAYDATGAVQRGVNGFDGSTALPEVRTGTLPPPPDTPLDAERHQVEEKRPEGDDEPSASAPAEPLEPPLQPGNPRPSEVSGPAGWPPGAAYPADYAADYPPADLTDAGEHQPAPRSPARTFGMAVLFLGGVFMILMIAIIASGLG